MDKTQKIAELRTRGWTYKKIGKEVNLSPRRVLIIWWKSHLTKKELQEYNRQVNLLSREKDRILREAAEKKGLIMRPRPQKE